MNLTWFYLHCFAAVAILWADATDRLEPAFNAFEKKIWLNGVRIELVLKELKVGFIVKE